MQLLIKLIPLIVCSAHSRQMWMLTHGHQTMMWLVVQEGRSSSPHARICLILGFVLLDAMRYLISWPVHPEILLPIQPTFKPGMEQAATMHCMSSTSMIIGTSLVPPTLTVYKAPLIRNKHGWTSTTRWWSQSRPPWTPSSLTYKLILTPKPTLLLDHSMVLIVEFWVSRFKIGVMLAVLEFCPPFSIILLCWRWLVMGFCFWLVVGFVLELGILNIHKKWTLKLGIKGFPSLFLLIGS